MVTLLWLYLVLFMIHEFEEIIFINSWKQRQSKSMKVYQDFLSTESFTLAVFLEYIVISLITLHAVYSQFYYIWIGISIAVIIHYIGHILITIIYRDCVPGLITAIIVAIPSIYIVYEIIRINSLDYSQVSIWSILLTILLALNLKLLHRLMPTFHRYITKGTD